MRKRKGNLLQRTMASLLSAVLITGMALDAVPLTVLAQENGGGGYNPTEEATETESGEKESIPGSEEGTQESDGEETAADSVVKKTEDTEEPEDAKKSVENPEAEGQDGVSEQEPAGLAAEEEDADITDSNGVQTDEPLEPQKAVPAAGAVVDPSLYDVTWTSARDKGRATVVICGKGTATDRGMAVGSRNQAVTIKAMVLKGKNLKPYVEDVADMMNSIKNLFFKKQ